MTDLLERLHTYKGGRIAVYGLGTETERVLPEIEQEFQVIGLLDGYREEGILYGKPIISLQEAVARQAELILVVARPGSCRAIAKRIGRICRENRIALIDVRGKDLHDMNQVTYDFRKADGITKEGLAALLQGYDAVSIDLFDTLVMRQTLFSTDVFEMVDCRLRENGIRIRDFCRRRLESEKHLAKSAAPALVEIYSYMQDQEPAWEITPEELARLEWETDLGLAVPRGEMCAFMEQIHEQGKEIYIVSDSYYSKSQIIALLDKCGIRFYKDVFVSCEYGTAKTDRLFEKVRERIFGAKWIHIGDDLVADVESAQKQGIDACRIHSGLDLLELTGYFGLWDSIEGLADRIKAGMFVSRIFNSPFQFETEERKISVKSACDIGYLFFAPMISDFVLWFEEQVRRYDLQNLWFCARDGYLIRKMYDELQKDRSSVYFLTSRTAAIRAGVEDQEDIAYVDGMKFSGTIEEQLRERFGIDKAAERECADTASGSLTDYADAILRKASIHRENYQKYIAGLHIKEGDIAFFDFVSKGTSQMFIQKIVDRHLKGLYFLQLEGEYMQGKGLDILSFYDKEETERSTIYENYYILETMLTSPMPSVKEFDEHGAPCYARETRKKEDIACALEIQEGILEYFKTYLKICRGPERKAGKETDEVFLGLIHKISILNTDFNSLKVEDPFFNRMTDVADLM